MFGIGLPELVFLVIVALLVFDAKTLPGVVRSAAKAIMTFRQATQDIRSSLDEEIGRVKRDVEEGLNQAEGKENGQTKQT